MTGFDSRTQEQKWRVLNNFSKFVYGFKITVLLTLVLKSKNYIIVIINYVEIFRKIPNSSSVKIVKPNNRLQQK